MDTDIYTWSDEGTEQRRLIKKSEKIRTPGLELQRKHVSCNQRHQSQKYTFTICLNCLSRAVLLNGGDNGFQSLAEATKSRKLPAMRRAACTI